MSYTTHEAANAFPMMDGKSLGELAEDIRKNGLKVPIALYEGKVLDGRNRMLACNDAGVTPEFKDITGSVDDPFMWVWSLNGERRHLSSQEQKALIWRKLHGMSEEMQQHRAKVKREADKARSEAAKAQHKVSNPRAGEVVSGSCTDCTTTKKKVAKTREAEAKAAGVNKGALARADALRNKAPELADKVADGAMTFAEASKAANVHVSNNSGENEWYTPVRFIEAARQCMGGIDLDPASCAAANENVKARKFYDQDADGLKQPWHGRIWMNPPYAQPLIGQFCEALASRWNDGDVDQAVVLVNNGTETKWFAELASVASAVCLPRGRIKFIDKNGNPSGAPLQGQAIVYVGPRIDAFKSAFSQFGTIMEVIHA